jgi:hypothetical protein
MNLMFLVGYAARYASKLYAVYAKKMPFYIEHWEDFITGGIDDMASRTVVDWKNVIQAIETGKGIILQNESFSSGQFHNVKRDHHSISEISSIVSLIIDKLNPKINRKKHGVEFSIVEDGPTIDRLIYKSDIENPIESPPLNAFGYTGLRIF